ncbi:MAG: hypothetical protein LBG63_03135, partial [Candidatus Methanoplasma sp.]|nr:hypothetical protein [Candidatus Methanoplasma sp.]
MNYKIKDMISRTHSSVEFRVLCFVLIAVITASVYFLPMQSDDSSAAATGNYEVAGGITGTYSDLKVAADAINSNGGTYYTIIAHSDDPNVSAFTVKAGKNVTLTSSE